MSASKPTLTPMMQQYHSIRQGLGEDTLLLFRLGDFYEIFLSDAERGAKLLGITLTQRHGMAMAGIPYHAADGYIQKLLDRGIKVAICDQVETPQPGKLVERKLTRIITPGTRLEETQLEAGRNQFLIAVECNRKGLRAAWLDLTTGEFGIAEDSEPNNLGPLLTSLDASEWVIPEKGPELWQTFATGQHFAEQFEQLTAGKTITPIPDYHFEQASGARLTMETLGVMNLEGFGVDKQHPALGAAGAVVHYASETLCAKPANLRRIKEYRSGQALLLDPATLRSLEIFKTAGNVRSGSLIDAMDATVSAAGARLLERWLSNPLLDLSEIHRRQACVAEFFDAPGLTGELQKYLKGIRDLERILSRLQNRIQNPRELGGIRETLTVLPAITQFLLEFPDTPVANLASQIHDFEELRQILNAALNETLPGNIQEGGTIADNYDAELDRLRHLMRDNKTWLSELEQKEQAETGIKNLRIRYNSAVGYFIEITKSQLGNVPAHYIRKQTMKNAERFYTDVLKAREREILNAEERTIHRETEIFAKLIEAILAETTALEKTAQTLAEIDVFLGWSTLAREWDYCRPAVNDSDQLVIEKGRHPVVEQMMRKERLGLAGTHAFVPNDTELSASAQRNLAQIGLITGPNMAGKSTYIRQVALITLMAQVGSWVPAEKVELGLVDRIFSRVGASDELARGNSTFMVEMNETANILNNASSRSLVILDEIGRGTSTYDGLSIAWAVIEHLHNGANVKPTPTGPRTLFATHYHELTQLAKTLSRLRNYTVVVKEWNDEIIFVRQVIPGAADRSYGIQVARLAGLPDSVIARARSILERLEADDSSHNLLRKRMRKEKSGDTTTDEDQQLALF